MLRKHSKKREAILALLRSTDRHPSAQWIYETLRPTIPDLSLGTVYRNLSVFLTDGEAVSVGVVGGEERFDGTVAPHPHLVCGNCGAVADLPPPDAEALSLLHAALPDSLCVDHRKTLYRGLCEECRAKKAKA